MADNRGFDAQVGSHPLPPDWLSVDLDSCHVHEAAPSMAAAGQEIRETDLVHLTQVRFLDPRLTSSDDARDVEREPADRGDRELGLEEQRRIARRCAFTVVANEPRAIRKL